MNSFDDIIRILFLNKEGAFNWDIVANLLTSISLVLVAFSIHEMRKQRKESYKPLLLLENVMFYLQKNLDGVPANLTKTLEVHRGFSQPPTKLTLQNVGLASAVMVKVSWTNGNRELMNALDELNETGSGLTKSDFDHSVYYQENSVVPGKMFTFRVPRTAEFETVTYVKEGDSYDLRLPDSISTYLCLVLPMKLASLRNVNAINETFEIPMLVEMQYQDIAGNRYKSRWKVEVDGYFSRNGWGENQFTVGQLNVRFKLVEPS